MGFTNGGGFYQGPAPAAAAATQTVGTYTTLNVTGETTTDSLSAGNTTITGTFQDSGMSHLTVATVGSSSNITSTTYAAVPGAGAISETVTCPPSGRLTVLFAAQINIGSPASTDEAFVSIKIENTTAGSTPFSPLDKRAIVISSNLGTNSSPGVALSRFITASALGATGDTLVVTLECRATTANVYGISATEMTIIPSP